MSVATNALANYAGQLYVLAIGIIITPLYLQYLGASAFGLVGFFTLMQAWMSLLDMGISPTLGRQVAFARGKENGFVSFKRLLRSFEMIFLALSLILFISTFILKDWIVGSWINIGDLNENDVRYCILVMGGLISIRLFSGLYRSGISGLEEQIVLNVANVIIISFKFIGSWFLLAFITHEVQHFFEYQLLIGIFELLLFCCLFYRSLPASCERTPLVFFDWSVIKSVAPYTLSIAYTAGIWILITQTDKLILSSILTLSEFGYFSLIALVAGGITMLAGPIAQAVMPRLTLLVAQGRQEEMINIYLLFSQITAILVFSIACIFGLYAEPLLYAWTGEVAPAKWGGDILVWFSLGNAVLALGAFQYYLQSAFGQLRLHVIGSTVSAIIQLPLIYYASTRYGAAGAGVAWFCFRCIWFMVWTPVVHNQFAKGIHLRWLIKKIIPVLTSVILSLWLLNLNFEISLSENRLYLFCKIFILGAAVICLSSLTLSPIRNYFFKAVCRVLHPT